MSEHEQKSKGTDVDTKQGLGVPPSTFTIERNSPPSIMSNQNSLSLGTLGSLNISPAPSLLSVSLSSLSLNNPKLSITNTSVAAPPGFSSLSSVFQSSHHSAGTGTRCRATVADTKGSPSLADLIQEHSNRIPIISHSGPDLNGSVASVKCQVPTAPAQTLSLSELASQHQNRVTYIQPQQLRKEIPTNTIAFSKPTNITPTCLGGSVHLSLLASQHQTKHTVPSPQPVSTESPANALKQPPGLSELFSLSHLASEDKGKTSTTSNGSQYSLTSLFSPAKPEGEGVLAEGTKEGVTMHRFNHKPYHQKCGPIKTGQIIDLSALMAQSHGVDPHHFDNDLPSPSSLTPVELGLDSSVFARPSAFAITLSIQSRRQPRRTRSIIKGRIRESKMGSGYQTFVCKVQDNSKEQLTPLSPITPFHFDIPSPDDVVRANQSKAFTR